MANDDVENLLRYQKLAACLMYILHRNGILTSDKAKEFGKALIPDDGPEPYKIMNQVSQELWKEDLVPSSPQSANGGLITNGSRTH